MIVLRQHSPGVWKSDCGIYHVKMLPSRKWEVSRRYANYNRRPWGTTFRTLGDACNEIEKRSGHTVKQRVKGNPNAGRPPKGKEALSERWTMRLEPSDRRHIKRISERYGISQNTLMLELLRRLVRRCHNNKPPVWLTDPTKGEEAA